MSKDMSLLDPAFREKYEVCLAVCKARSIEMRPFFTLRTPWEQARIYRRSRSWSRISASIRMLHNEGAHYIAQVLSDVGPQHGNWGTNALPGQSWHQWGLACDAAVVDSGGDFVWNGSHYGYKVYKEESEKLGLENLDQIHDYCHVQFNRQEVRDVYTWADIDRIMKDKFGTKEP
jgi:hypothetical protein